MSRRRKKSAVSDPNRPRRVALIIETSLISGRDILRGVARYLRERGPWTILHQARSLDEPPPRWLARFEGDGVIARLQDKRMARAVSATGLPAVDVLGVAPHRDVPLVHVDGSAVAQLAADHLAERGFKRFAFVDVAGESWSTRRREGFIAAAHERGCDCDVFTAQRRPRDLPPWESIDAKMVEWIVSLPKPLGLMVATDELGPPVLAACRRANAAVPDDVAVIGVGDDDVLCDLASPPMSSVVPDHVGVGYEAARLLDAMMRGEPRPDAARFLPPLGVVTRQSTDVLAIDDDAVAAALRFIRENATAGVGVDAVVGHVPLSRSALQRRFNESVGRTINDQLVLTRVNRARELLVHTDMSLDAIARRAGFNHREYLSVVFKRETGATPAAYRKRHRQ